MCRKTMSQRQCGTSQTTAGHVVIAGESIASDPALMFRYAECTFVRPKPQDAVIEMRRAASSNNGVTEIMRKQDLRLQWESLTLQLEKQLASICERLAGQCVDGVRLCIQLESQLCQFCEKPFPATGAEMNARTRQANRLVKRWRRLTRHPQATNSADTASPAVATATEQPRFRSVVSA